MNETIILPDAGRATAAALPPTARVCRTLVLDAFKRMTRGRLRLTLPDGTELEIGSPAAGVEAAITVTNPAFFKKCVLFGDVGFAESYIDGDWDTPSIERVVSWAILNVESAPGASGGKVRHLALNLLRGYNRLQHLLRPNSVSVSRRNIAEHYDLGNEFYALWLDRTMTYSSARYTSPDQSLDSAQEAKYEALCRKLRLRKEDHVLEIGCGWGGFSEHAAKRYGCRVTAITISRAQFDFAVERMRRAGLGHLVEIRLQDYRQTTGQFDKVASIEMMEALGDRYLETFFECIHRVLKPAGLIALQYITVPDCRHADLRRGVDFIQKHVFPGSLLLSVGRVNQAINRTGDLFMHELEDLGSSYARTLREWWQRFNSRIAEIQEQGFDPAFVRKWNYYLQYCEAAFAMRNISVVQAAYTRPNNLSLHEGRYEAAG